MKTDTQLQQDVMAELIWEPSVNASNIGVTVNNGIVNLNGHVDTYAEKSDAERTVMRVSGVQALSVNIDVRLPGLSIRTDADIALSVENALQWMTYTPKDRVHVMVENGSVTLTGELEWTYQRQAVLEAVRYLMGVTGINDQMTLTVKVSSAEVKTGIEAALKRRAHTDAASIQVVIQDTEVTLSGVAHSWSERDLARQAAWAAPGVTNVIDRMTVVD
ncbi:MAG TPA: BON domain-containing protein [Fluviicoccus sp.]|nr:BON domain-containing protein [Fluviicoccus sp.]